LPRLLSVFVTASRFVSVLAKKFSILPMGQGKKSDAEVTSI